VQTAAFSRSQVLDVVRQFWGFDALRPIQEEAIRTALAGQDSLVVMPTGGGKSLCYQVPPLVTGGLGVVVSPLIALMKDQVDGLKLAGVPAAALHSGLDRDEARETEEQMGRGELRLLFVAPERLLTSGLLAKLVKADTASFAIDEAHCISQWGHDFRPEYRRLASLREVFPQASFHAFTATATEQVREDIIQQLKLREPRVLVGPFDRPNLTYRVVPRQRVEQQCAELIGRHQSGEAAGATIVYCLSRRNTEELAAVLRGMKIHAQAYHAGLSAAERHRVQDDFADERLDVVVATVAFGMGIDRSNVRCVIHATMPKSVEHYQQETGRAGRDGLPAECVLLYSTGDAARWQRILREAAFENGGSEESLRVQLQLIERMQRFASSTVCRHRALAEYFGQPYVAPAASAAGAGCGACDVCLSELSAAPESTQLAQKILSCVYRVGQNFGPAHVAHVLRGSSNQKIIDWRHDQLSTFGLLRGMPRPVVLAYIDQLLSQGLLVLAGDPYAVLRLTPEAVPVLKGEREVSLVQPAGRAAMEEREPRRARGGAPAGEEAPLSDEEGRLFDSLRRLRFAVAKDRNVPPYVIFHDTVLREMARSRPRTVGQLGQIRGVGQKKLSEFGPAFLEHIAGFDGSAE
jgi:ATP-dependent DNA helicase RecQ